MAASLRIILLTAIAYFVAGLIGQFFSVPPGFATIIWPASGIALGATIMFGQRAILGVLLGSFAVNIYITYINAGQWTLLIPFLIALGAMLQTWVSLKLIKRFVGDVLQFFQLRHAVLFVILGGPIGCLVSATTGSAVLLYFDAIHIDNLLLNWASWWAGDIVGVLVVIPWLAVLFPKQFDVYFDHPKRVIGTLFFVALATALLSLIVAQFEHNKQQQSFQDSARVMYNSMSERIKNSVDILYGLRGMVRGSTEVTEENFYSFAESVMVRDRAIQAMSINYVVDGTELGDFEQRMSALYGDTFKVMERDINNELVPVSPRERHVVVGLIYPKESNQKAIGYDVYSQRDRRHTIDEAIRLNSATPTPAIQLVQGNRGVLIFLPVYRDGKLFAMATGLFDVSSLTASTFERKTDDNVEVYVVDRRIDNAPYILTNSNNAQLDIAALSNALNSRFGHAQFRELVPIGASSWELIHLAPSYFIHQPWTTQFTLAGGMFLAGLLGWVFLLVFSHTAQIEQQVVARTRALSFANRSLRASESRLKAAIAEAEEANLAKSHFLANMSHEIRTPLNGLLGSLVMLQAKTLTTEQKNLVELAQQSGDSLLDLINDILDLSKIEAGELELEPQYFVIQDVLEDIATLMRPRAHAKQIELVAPANVLPEVQVWADRVRLRQILVNLIGNAIKFTAHGQVTVATEYEVTSDHTIQLRFIVQDTGIGISIAAQKKLFLRFKQADGSTTRQYGGTGLGLAISKELTDAMGGEIYAQSEQGVGSRFTLSLTLGYQKAAPLVIQESALLTNGVTLVGAIGQDEPYIRSVLTELSVPLRNVESLDDALALDDKSTLIMDATKVAQADMGKLASHQGGVLLVVDQTSDLPAYDKVTYSVVHQPIHRRSLLTALDNAVNFQPNTPPQVEKDTKEHQFMGKVLLVEDNATNQLVAKGILSLLGVEVDVAGHGQEALTKVRDKAYDLIFMDCQMPVMDGYEATKRIRKLEGGTPTPADVPIVALSANAMKGDDAACLSVGMNDHVAKPISKPRLEQVLSKWLRNKA